MSGSSSATRCFTRAPYDAKPTVGFASANNPVIRDIRETGMYVEVSAERKGV